jgi:hypothetical protein
MHHIEERVMNPRKLGLIAGALAVVSVVAAGIVLALPGSDSSPPAGESAIVQTQTLPTTVPTARPLPTSAPTQPPAPTEPPPTASPPPPANRTCAAIRASGTYQSDAERAFFLSSCQTQPAVAPAGGATQAPAPPSQPQQQPAAPTADEQTFRNRVTAIAAATLNRIIQFERTFTQTL